MDQAEPKKVIGYGASDTMDGSDVAAEHYSDRVVFGMHGRDKKILLVSAPVLSTADAKKWVEQRIADFKKNYFAAESYDHAIRRKAIAAQGKGFVDKLWNVLDEMGKMELDMMYSPDSHFQLLPLNEARKGEPVSINRAGRVQRATVEWKDNEGNGLIEATGSSSEKEGYRPSPWLRTADTHR